MILNTDSEESPRIYQFQVLHCPELYDSSVRVPTSYPCKNDDKPRGVCPFPSDAASEFSPALHIPQQFVYIW